MKVRCLLESGEIETWLYVLIANIYQPVVAARPVGRFNVVMRWKMKLLKSDIMEKQYRCCLESNMAEGTARNIMLKVDDDRCQVCGTCLAKDICRGNAFLTYDPGEAPFIDMSRCWGCMECVIICPFDAVVRHTYGSGG